MTDKRFEIRFDGNRYFVVVDIQNERGIARMDTMLDARGFLEMYQMLNDENKQLKQQIQSIKNVIQQLNDADYYLDSAILDEAMQKIANLIGEEWE